MWGEFNSDEQTKSTVDSKDVIPEQRKTPEKLSKIEDNEVLPLRERIIHYLASTSVTLKSQQRYEPDFTFEERKAQAGELLEKPGQFLYRFGKLLLREHFLYFLQYEGDPEVDHYLTESLKHLNTHTAKVTVQNRRYAAMQKLRHSSDYFSEKEMERRNPLLYDQLIAQHQTHEERAEQDESDFNLQTGFSSLLLKHMDNYSERNLKNQLKEEEDDMLEEEETDGEEEDEEESEELGNVVDSRQKELLREEFYSLSYQSFLRGNDKDFDYSQVDASDEYDLLDIQARDEEERYFDEDDEDGDGNDSSKGSNSAHSTSLSTPNLQSKTMRYIPDTRNNFVTVSSENVSDISCKESNHMDVDNT